MPARHAVSEEKVRTALEEVGAEYQRGRTIHGQMASRHEGWAVIWEELDELWDEVRKRHPEKRLLRKEATQVAAMALAFMLEVTE